MDDHLPPGLRLMASEWRAFAAPAYRRYLVLALCQGVVLALSGVALAIPLLIELGLGPGPTTLVASLAVIGPAAQFAVPGLLRRTDGNLRLVTLASAALGETRGLWLGLIAVLVALGVGNALLVAGLVLATAAMGVFSGVASANLQAWLAVILPEQERRFVAPRIVGLGLAVSAVLLVLVALVLDAAARAFGVGIYAVCFLAAGVAGAVEVAALSRLPSPGRVRVPRLGPEMPAPPGWRRFVAIATLASLGSGLAPYYSVYVMSVLRASASFAVALSALTSGAAVLASTFGAALLAHNSSSRLLRLGYLSLGGGWIAALATTPLNPLALPWFVAIALFVSAGGAIVQIATNERLFRLAAGPAVMAQQGRFVAIASGATAAGQLASALALAVAPVGYPVFAVLFVVSGAARFAAASRLPVPESWSDATAVIDLADLGRS